MPQKTRTPNLQNIPIHTPEGDRIKNLLQKKDPLFPNVDYATLEKIFGVAK